MFKTYQKDPDIIVEAIQYTEKSKFFVAEWAIKRHGAKEVNFITSQTAGRFHIRTGENSFSGKNGDFVIKGSEGSFSIVDVDTFKSQYKEVK